MDSVANIQRIHLTIVLAYIIPVQILQSQGQFQLKNMNTIIQGHVVHILNNQL